MKKATIVLLAATWMAVIGCQPGDNSNNNNSTPPRTNNPPANTNQMTNPPAAQ